MRRRTACLAQTLTLLITRPSAANDDVADLLKLLRASGQG
jgi:hypothetical protein